MNKKRLGIVFVSLVFVLSMILKFIYILKIPLNPIQDFETLYTVAVNLFSGKGFTLNGYDWGFQSYGYPLILSLFFRLVGSSSIFTAKIFNLIISMLTLIVFYLIFDKVFAKKSVTYICYTLMAFLPNNIIYNNVLGTEILSAFLLAIVILLNLNLNDKNKYINFIFQGIVTGILSLVKPFFMAYPIVIIFVYLIKEKNLKILLKYSLFLITGFMLIMIPSIIKNYRQFNAFIPISYNGGFTLYINNNSQNNRGTWMNGFDVEATDEFRNKLKEVGYDITPNAAIEKQEDLRKYKALAEKQENLRNYKASAIFKDEAVKWILKNPVEFITLGFLRITNVFFQGAGDVQLWGFEAQTIKGMTIQQNRIFKVFLAISDALIYLLSISFIIYLLLNIINIFLKKTELKVLITIWTMSFFYAVYFVVEGQSRYNFPTLFLMAMCFGWLLEKILYKEDKNG